MTRFAWLSANELGRAVLDAVVALDDPHIELVGLLTLKPGASTVMYDAVPLDSWLSTGVEVFAIDRIETDGAEVLRQLAPDYVVMAGWRQMVPREVLEIPRHGFVSFHPTRLPWGRGPAPIINQILAGTKGSAMSFMYTDDGVDSGDLIGLGHFQIEPDDHAMDVCAKVVEQGVALGVKHLPQLARGTAPRTPQDESVAFVFPKPKRANFIELDDSIETTYRRIRALSEPYRGAHFTDPSGNRLVVWRAMLTEHPQGTRIKQDLDLSKHRARENQLYFSDDEQHLQVVRGEIQLA